MEHSRGKWSFFDNLPLVFSYFILFPWSGLPRKSPRISLQEWQPHFKLFCAITNYKCESFPCSWWNPLSPMVSEGFGARNVTRKICPTAAVNLRMSPKISCAHCGWPFFGYNCLFLWDCADYIWLYILKLGSPVGVYNWYDSDHNWKNNWYFFLGYTCSISESSIQIKPPDFQCLW